MPLNYISNARYSRILAAISFHYVETRLIYLAEVVRELSAFPVEAINIVIFTNATDFHRLEVIKTSLSGTSCEIISVPKLEHPFDLTWAHKEIISNRFVAKKDDSHFIYLEDDERMSFSNFCYFVEARELLREHGLIPGFARTEWSSRSQCFVNTDNDQAISLLDRASVQCGPYSYIALENPYCGTFILDQELAEEYIASLSFDRLLSCKVSEWEVRERSAMGLTFEAVPKAFSARGVVPIDTPTMTILSRATIVHLPNNYANNPHTGFGKIPMAALLTVSAPSQKKGHSNTSISQRILRPMRVMVKTIIKRIIGK